MNVLLIFIYLYYYMYTALVAVLFTARYERLRYNGIDQPYPTFFFYSGHKHVSITVRGPQAKIILVLIKT